MRKFVFILFLLFCHYPVFGFWTDSTSRESDVIIAKNPIAPIEVIMYYSFSCAHCAQFHKESWDKFQKEYVDTGKVKIVLRDVAIDKLGYCASNYAQTLDKENYLKLFHASMKHHDEWMRQKDYVSFFKKIIQMEGLPDADLLKLQDDKEISDRVLKRWSDAKKRYYLDGTPAFVINGKIYNYFMSYNDFEQKVKEELKKMTDSVK